MAARQPRAPANPPTPVDAPVTTLSSARADALLRLIAGRRLLVLGDLMLDEYHFGEVTRISAEAPVPVVRITRESLRLGGAGNVAANARALGADVRLVGVLGDNRAGERFRATVTEQQLASDGLVRDPGRPTTVKTRVIAQGQQVVRCDREEVRPLEGEVEDRLVRAALAALEDCQAVVVSDYAKGLLTPRVLNEVFAAAAAHGLPVVVDPAVRSFPLYHPVTALTPNHHEAALASGVHGHDDAAVVEMGRRILEQLAPRALLVTRSEAGMSLFERDGGVTHIPTVAREVYDVTGAGDSVSTVFTLVLACGGSLLEAAVLSNHAAGVVVGKVGTATATADEVLSSFS